MEYVIIAVVILGIGFWAYQESKTPPVVKPTPSSLRVTVLFVLSIDLIEFTVVTESGEPSSTMVIPTTNLRNAELSVIVKVSLGYDPVDILVTLTDTTLNSSKSLSSLIVIKLIFN